MHSLPGELAPRDLGQAEASMRAGAPKHISLDVDTIKAAARPTRRHFDRTLHP
jgi:hypothetical protein